MMTNNQAISILTAALTTNNYPLSYLSELIRFIGLRYTDNQAITIEQEALIQQTLHNLSAQTPIEYIVGEALFFERRFKVSKDVLIPRFDTERLVEMAIKKANEIATPLSIVDIGTGSGAIIITLAKELTNFVNDEFIAIDISDSALTIAKMNAEIFGVSDRIFFQIANTYPTNRSGDWLLPSHNTVILISNPPYITNKQMTLLPESVKNYEPDIALREQKDFIPKLQNYIDLLTQQRKIVHTLLEYNNTQGVMEHFYFSPGQRLSIT